MIERESAPLAKAYVVQAAEQVEATRLQPMSEDEKTFYSQTDAIPPPYDQESLVLLFEQSSALRPNVDALTTNVEILGYRLVPIVDLQSAKADDQIRELLRAEALYDGEIPDVSKDAVAGRREELEELTRIEFLRTSVFLDTVYADGSLESLREQMRVDLEVTGNAYWEVLRNNVGDVAGLNYVASIYMRLLRVDEELHPVKRTIRVGASIRRIETKRRFRRFVQWSQGLPVVFFKEFGDRRVMSSETGRFYETREALMVAEPQAPEASEVIHFRIHSPRTVYGIPRWIGAVRAVYGTRESEGVNASYFKQKAIPPFVILVSGGTLADGASQRITNYIRDRIKGAEHFHDILVLEAESQSGTISTAQTGRVRIELKSLMDAQQKDALFQGYEQNNALKVGAQFRIPKLLRGDQEDANRSTSDNVVRVTEQQVFQPERQKVDWIMNLLLVDREVRFHKFVSNGPVERDPVQLVDMIEKLSKAVITPNEGREIAADALDTRLEKVDAPWARIPIEAAKAGFAPEPTAEEIEQGKEPQAPSPKLVQGSLDYEAQRLMLVRSALKEAEGKAAQDDLMTQRRSEGEHVVQVPPEEFSKWFTKPVGEG